MPALPYFEIHSFADPSRPFSGNPAGVCLMESFPRYDVLLGIAQSNNLSETAFMAPTGEDTWDLRWLTPETEVALCGHATLAAGAAALQEGWVKGAKAMFDSQSGRLEVARDGEAYAMDLPRVGFGAGTRRDAMQGALGVAGDVEAVFAVDNIHGSAYEMWVVKEERQVAEAEPDFNALGLLGANVILTAPGEDEDFVSRFFAPASGVPEDPVTGSAHCTLTPYWSEKLGKTRMTARQIGPRPGALEVEDRGERIGLFGRAPRYLTGEISW
jgi:PhzF family phenazine biosynthesis protein